MSVFNLVQRSGHYLEPSTKVPLTHHSQPYVYWDWSDLLSYLVSDMLIKLFKTLVCPMLEYGGRPFFALDQRKVQCKANIYYQYLERQALRGETFNTPVTIFWLIHITEVTWYLFSTTTLILLYIPTPIPPSPGDTSSIV